MRRKFFNGKRVLALVLSLSLVMGEAVFAVPVADVQPAAVEETADADVRMAEDAAVQDDVAEEPAAEDVIFEEADGDGAEADAQEAQEAADEDAAVEIVSANDVADTEAQEATDEDAQENALQETEETGETQEDALDVEEAADGTLSKVIGLEGKDGYNGSFTNDDGETVERYTNVWTYQDTIYVKGKLTPDEKTGWVTYNGKTYLGWGYSYNQATDESSLDPYYEISVLPGTSSSDYQDAANGLYKINGSYYDSMNSTKVDGVTKLYYYPNRGTAIPVTRADNDDKQAINKAYGRYTKTAAYYGETDPQKLYSYDPSYYVIGGKMYTDIYNRSIYQNGKSSYCWYVLQTEEISLTNRKINVTWNYLTNPNINLDKYQPKSNIMYEVKVNGQPAKNLSHYYDAKGNVYYCTGSSSYTTKEAYAAGQGVKLQVRGVFYHYVNKQYTNEDGEQVASDVVVIDGAGPWSDEYSYSVTGQKRAQVPAVTGVTATDMSVMGSSYNSVLVKWNPVPQARYYFVYCVASKKQLAMTVADFEKYYYYDKDTQLLAQKGLTEADLQTNYSSTSKPEWTQSQYGETEYVYRYYAVVPADVADYDLYENKVSSLDKITTFASVKLADKAVAKTPALQNFKAEKQADGTVDLVWDKVDANVVIYAYDQSTFPKMFQYKPFEYNVKRVEYRKDAAGNIVKDSYGRPQVERTTSLSTDMSGSSVYDPATQKSVVNISTQDMAAYRKVEYKDYVSGSNGRLNDVIGYMDLVRGRTYYFVACTYDNNAPYQYEQELSGGNYKSLAKAPVANSFTGRYRENGIAKTTAVNVSYTYYPAMGPLTGVVSAKAKVSKPTVQTLPDKKSIKLSLSNGMGTGYEIYRKSGKKYKKIATTTSNVYVDEGLKTGASYSYKVRSYYYDMGAKKTVYSDYRYVTTKTIPADAFELHAVKSSKTGVKLNWNKVAKATKYELYRSDLKNSDPNVISKKYSAAGFKRSLSSTGYKLIKTLSKGKTTYTDKKLKADEEYSYIIIAYYKDGKSTQMMLAGDSVVLAVTEPANIKAVNKGSKVVVSWDADKYAAGYEIEYYVRDKYGVKKSTVPVTVTTKKNSLTISGIETGGYVSDVRVRAYNSKKEYSEWASYGSSEDISLGAVKGITAKAVTAKNGSQGVKISWKKVSGAKYYKVYRSTQMPVYDADEKLYRTDYDDNSGFNTDYKKSRTGIAKEGNDNYAKEDSISSLTGGYLYNNEVYYDEYMGVSNSVTGTTAYDYGTLAGGVTYYYTVVAFGEVPSGGSDSYVKSVYCSKPGSVTAKSNLNVKATSKKGKVTLKWSKIAGTSGVKYTIYRSTKAKGKYTKIGTTKKTSFTDKKSKKGKTYYYKVAVTSGKNALKADFTVTSPAKKVKAK